SRERAPHRLRRVGRRGRERAHARRVSEGFARGRAESARGWPGMRGKQPSEPGPKGRRRPRAGGDGVARLENELHALEVRNRKLGDQQAGLRRSERRYADLYHEAPIGYFVLGRDGKIVDVNAWGAQRLGRTRRKLVGLSLFEFLPALRDRVAFFDY